MTVSEYEAVFLPAGTRDGAQLWTPTDLARGPWSPDAMHGGAPAALLARAVEGHDPGPAHFVVRLTIDLLRPVPLVPVSIHARTTRPGRKVQWVEAQDETGRYKKDLSKPYRERGNKVDGVVKAGSGRRAPAPADPRGVKAAAKDAAAAGLSHRNPEP